MNQNVIFTWKLVSIGICITNGYAAIAHFRDHPIFGVMYYGIFFDVALFYTIAYQKAFKIPALLTQAKTLLQVEASMLRRPESRLLRKQVMSIQPVGIKVGEFRTLERNSTLVFLN